MDEHIAGLLGIDPTDPKIARASANAERIMNLIETLVKHRKTRGLTQREVAAAMETTQSAVSDLERLGGDPKLSTLLKYADAVGLDIHFGVHATGDLSTSAWTQVADTEERVPRVHRTRKAS